MQPLRIEPGLVVELSIGSGLHSSDAFPSHSNVTLASREAGQTPTPLTTDERIRRRHLDSVVYEQR
jgi:hypothetical protein